MLPNELDARRVLPLLAVQRAQLLAGAIRLRDPESIDGLLLNLDRRELIELAFAAAAMLPVDSSPSELLAWNDTEIGAVLATVPPVLQPHGTRAAYERHRVNGEVPCDPCRAASRDYHRARNLRNRLALVGAS